MELVFLVLTGGIASVIDQRTHTIPNLLTLSILGIGLVYNLVLLVVPGFAGIGVSFGTPLARIGTALGIFFIGLALSSFWSKSLGMGDVKLLAGWSLVLGPLVILSGLWVASMLGILYFLLFRRRSLSSRLPFAPFLLAGTAAAYALRPHLAALFGSF